MVIILGTAAKGGISGVINDHIACGLYDKTGFIRIVTHEGNSKFGDIKLLITSFFYLLKALLLNDVSIVHAHMSYNGSFWRKLLFLFLTKFFRKKFICHLHGSEFKLYVNRSSKLRLFLIGFLIKKVMIFSFYPMVGLIIYIV